MRQTGNGRLPLLVAPAITVAATLALLALTDQTGAVTLWGGLATLVAAVPSVVSRRYLRPAIWTCSALVTALVVGASASIGFFYAPAAIALPLSGLFARVRHGELRPGPSTRTPTRERARDRG